MNEEKSKLKEVLELIEQEIEVAEFTINATDEELEDIAGTLFGYNMRDYSRGSLDILKIIKKKLTE